MSVVKTLQDTSIDTKGNDNFISGDSSENLSNIEKGDKSIYSVLGVEDNLPSELNNSVEEIEKYVFDSLKTKRIDPTIPYMNEEINTVKQEIGLDENAPIETVIDRIGGVIKAWKELAFIKDIEEKKQIFMRLADAKTSKEMNKIVFEEMNRRSVWK